MSGGAGLKSVPDRIRAGAVKTLRALVLLMAVAAGAGILLMMLLTCLDVALRALGRPLVGAVDLVRMAGVLTLTCSLPYTTAIKGHVAIEYFFHKLSPRGRTATDAGARLLVMALFLLLARQSFLHGQALRLSGEVSPTLMAPVFWIPWVMGFSFFLVALVVLYNLTHPGREMIKP